MWGRKGEKSKRRQQNKVLHKEKALVDQIQVGMQLLSIHQPTTASCFQRTHDQHAQSPQERDAEHKRGLILHLPQAQVFPKAHRERCSHTEFWNNLCSALVISELSWVKEANPPHFPQKLQNVSSIICINTSRGGKKYTPTPSPSSSEAAGKHLSIRDRKQPSDFKDKSNLGIYKISNLSTPKVKHNQ